MQRMIALATSLVLGFATLVVVAAFASVATSPASIEQAGNTDHAVVERYYDAVNHMITSGDPEPLRQIVDPEAIDLEPAPAGFSGLEGLVRYLGSLRGTLPGIQIEPGQLYLAENGIVSQPTVAGDVDASVLGFSIDELQPIWPEIERFHIRNGRIVERAFTWSGLVLAEPLPLPMDESALAVAPQRQIESGILILPPGATMHDITAETAESLQPLTDGFLIRLPHPASSAAIVHTVSLAGQVSSHFIAPGGVVQLAPGEIITVPPGTAYSVSNERLTPAALFVLSVSIALAAADTVAPEAPLPFDGFEVRSLVRAESNPDDEWHVESGRVWLMPGADFRIATQTRLMAICEAFGAMRCLIWLPGNDPMTPWEEFPVSRAESPMALLSRVGAPDALMNAGEEAVLLWAFSVG